LNAIQTTAAIILAAGSSSRMGGGRHKLMLPLDGRPVLARVIDATLASQARPIVVVIGHQSAQVRSQIEHFTTYKDIVVIENAQFQEGMSSSLRLGIQTLLANGYKNDQAHYNIDSTLIMLGDQPLITSRIIDGLITAYRANGSLIVAPLYNGKRGNPVLFENSLFPELIEVTGDEGGRTVLNRHRDEVNLVEMGDSQANFDVDTWEAYEQVMKVWNDQPRE
jgi:molybdenum cofactor cytidylyltransferase